MRESILMATVFAVSLAGAQPVLAQASDRQIVFDPRVLNMPRKAPPQSDAASDLQVSREAGAGNIDVDSSTFDMFAQMVRRFNSLERRLDEVMQQNAALAQQLADARKEIDQANGSLRAVVRDASGRTLISLMGSTCTMTAELLGRMRAPDVSAGMIIETTVEVKDWKEWINEPC